MRKFVSTVCALLICSTLSACGGLKDYKSDFFSMDTFMSLHVWSDSEAKAQSIVSTTEQRINTLSTALSRQDSSSSVYALNAANGESVALDDDSYKALSRAVEFAKLTDGAFDPTTAPLSDLWGIGTDHAAIPSSQDLDAALQKIGYQNIELLPNNNVRLKNGAQVDLGGIGKGYATDVVSKMHGDVPMLAALGGNIGAYSKNPRTEDGMWKIGLANPDNSANYIATVNVRDESVVTSGDYERFFEQDGVRYHHIFDPKTGFPAKTDLRGVTVIDSDSTRADAMTTALFVMGLDRGMKFCEEQKIEAVFITAQRKIYTTAGLRDRLTLAQGVDYELIR